MHQTKPQPAIRTSNDRAVPELRLAWHRVDDRLIGQWTAVIDDELSAAEHPAAA
jgi:hypothetical protein